MIEFDNEFKSIFMECCGELLIISSAILIALILNKQNFFQNILGGTLTVLALALLFIFIGVIFRKYSRIRYK